MHQRSALYARHDHSVDIGGIFFFAHYDAAARAAQSLMSCRSYKIGVGHRRRMNPGCHQSGYVGDINHHQSTAGVAGFTEFGEI